MWDFVLGIVTADGIKLTAKYELKDIYYTVTYIDANGATIYTQQAKTAEDIVRLAAYEKATDVRYTYTFLYWTADEKTPYDFDTELTGDVVLSPVYETAERVYSVTLLNYDGSVFKVLEGEEGFKYGEQFNYPMDAEQPIKEIGDENSYVFDYWALTTDGKVACLLVRRRNSYVRNQSTGRLRSAYRKHGRAHRRYHGYFQDLQ